MVPGSPGPGGWVLFPARRLAPETARLHAADPALLHLQRARGLDQGRHQQPLDQEHHGRPGPHRQGRERLRRHDSLGRRYRVRPLCLLAHGQGQESFHTLRAGRHGLLDRLQLRWSGAHHPHHPAQQLRIHGLRLPGQHRDRDRPEGPLEEMHPGCAREPGEGDRTRPLAGRRRPQLHL